MHSLMLKVGRPLDLKCYGIQILVKALSPKDLVDLDKAEEQTQTSSQYLAWIASRCVVNEQGEPRLTIEQAETAGMDFLHEVNDYVRELTWPQKKMTES